MFCCDHLLHFFWLTQTVHPIQQRSKGKKKGADLFDIGCQRFHNVAEPAHYQWECITVTAGRPHPICLNCAGKSPCWCDISVFQRNAYCQLLPLIYRGYRICNQSSYPTLIFLYNSICTAVLVLLYKKGTCITM